MTAELQKAGGAASLITGLTYIIGFSLFVGVLDRSGYEGAGGNLAFALDNATVLSFAMIILYLVAAAALIILAVSLHHRLSQAANAWSQIMVGFGVAWAALVFGSGMIGLVGLEAVAEMAVTEPDRAATVWAAVGVVQDGLGGGIEFVGGVWIGLVSWLGIKSRSLPLLLNIVGFVIALAGLGSAIPQFGELVSIFGLAQIIWFLWVGVLLLRTSKCSQI